MRHRKFTSLVHACCSSRQTSPRRLRKDADRFCHVTLCIRARSSWRRSRVIGRLIRQRRSIVGMIPNDLLVSLNEGRSA
jgi:hypothetical protein